MDYVHDYVMFMYVKGKEIFQNAKPDDNFIADTEK